MHKGTLKKGNGQSHEGNEKPKAQKCFQKKAKNLSANQSLGKWQGTEKVQKKDGSKKKTSKGPKGILKKPASKLDTSEAGMSLEEKMEAFSKRQNGCVQTFLDQLTSHQREALWGRFQRARESLKDKEMDLRWSTHCKWPGSDSNRKALLKVFLANKGDLKKNDHYMKEMVSLTRVEGQRDTEEWVPFTSILQRYGLQEALRRATWLALSFVSFVSLSKSAGACTQHHICAVAGMCVVAPALPDQEGKHQMQKGSQRQSRMGVCIGQRGEIQGY